MTVALLIVLLLLAACIILLRRRPPLDANVESRVVRLLRGIVRQVTVPTPVLHSSPAVTEDDDPTEEITM